MVRNGLVAIFAGGAVGGFLAQVGHWYSLRESPNLPEYLRSSFYWIVTVAMIASGCVLAVLYGTANVNALLAVNVGASAPLIIKALAQTTPPPPPTPNAPGGGGGGAMTAGRESTASVASFLAGR